MVAAVVAMPAPRRDPAAPGHHRGARPAPGIKRALTQLFLLNEYSNELSAASEVHRRPYLRRPPTITRHELLDAIRPCLPPHLGLSGGPVLPLPVLSRNLFLGYNKQIHSSPPLEALNFRQEFFPFLLRAQESHLMGLRGSPVGVDLVVNPRKDTSVVAFPTVTPHKFADPHLAHLPLVVLHRFPRHLANEQQ